MSELSTPHTPRPDHTMRRESACTYSSAIGIKESEELNGRIGSPVGDVGAMTPPPSTQILKPPSKPAQIRSTSAREYSLASPPATLQSSPPITSGTLFGEIPSIETVESMDEGQLRGLVIELLPAFGEARVNAAHSKLQHSLLSIETEEAAKRAAVEHEATRREVQVLQQGSPVHRHALSPRSFQVSVQRNLEMALAHCRELQQENALLEKRVRASKKVIVQLDEENEKLKGDVQLLRQRIKENRDHVDQLQSAGAISLTNTPVMEYITPINDRTPRTPTTLNGPSRDDQLGARQDPFDALLLAGQVMTGEASSVPSSPQQPRTKRLQPHHIRGAHSLSSLPTTPQRSRPVTADDALITPIRPTDSRVSFSAPGTQAYHEDIRSREERESTISASEDDEDRYHDEDMPGSQASQMATDMLRRSLTSQNTSNIGHNRRLETTKLMQTKLVGNVTKPLNATAKFSKRGPESSPNNDTLKSKKKAKTANSQSKRIGLGIRT